MQVLFAGGQVETSTLPVRRPGRLEPTAGSGACTSLFFLRPHSRQQAVVGGDEDGVVENVEKERVQCAGH